MTNDYTEKMHDVIQTLGTLRAENDIRSMLMFITPDGKHVGFANNIADGPVGSLAMMKVCITDILNHAQIDPAVITKFQQDIDDICQQHGSTQAVEEGKQNVKKKED